MSLLRLVEIFVGSTNLASDAILLKTIILPNALIFAIFEISKDTANKIWGMDNFVPNRLTRVPHLKGSRSAYVGNDMFRNGLFDTTIY